MKTQIIGYSGSGKSTLAAKIAQTQQIPVLHLDCVHWLPGWQERDRNETSEIVRTFLDTHDAWVIDGNYTKHSYDRRMQEADRIIFMNFNRFSCLWRAIMRRIRYHGRTRASITEGCNERISFEFLRFMFLTSRNKRAKARYRTLSQQYADKFITIRNQRELDRFVQQERL